MSLNIELGITSADAVTLIALETSTFGKRQIKSDHRSKGGKHYLYKWGDFKKIKYDLKLMPASDTALINSWFDTNAELLLFITSDSVTEVHSVMIMNDETPLAKVQKPYTDLYNGKLELESY